MKIIMMILFVVMFIPAMITVAFQMALAYVEDWLDNHV